MAQHNQGMSDSWVQFEGASYLCILNDSNIFPSRMVGYQYSPERGSFVTPQHPSCTTKYVCAKCLGKECDECRTRNPKMIVRSDWVSGNEWRKAGWINSKPFERTDVIIRR